MPSRKRVRVVVAERRRPRKRASAGGMASGRLSGNQQTLRVNYRELWGPVPASTSAAGSSPAALVFLPGNSGMAQLDALGSLYESYRLTAPVKVQFKSASGTINNGSMLVGIDFDARDISLGYQAVAAMNPKAVGPVFKDSQVMVDHNRAMNKKWLFSNSAVAAGEAAFAAVFSTTSTQASGVGDIWCEYSVEFISPKIYNPGQSMTNTVVLATGDVISSIPDAIGINAPALLSVTSAGSSTTQANIGYTAAGGNILPGNYLFHGMSLSGTGATNGIPVEISTGPGWNVLDQTLPDPGGAGDGWSILLQFVGTAAAAIGSKVLAFGITKLASDALAVPNTFNRFSKDEL